MTSRAIEFGLSRLGFKYIIQYNNKSKVVEAYLAGRDDSSYIAIYVG